MTSPYWEDAGTGLRLYLGKMEDVLPTLDVTADLIVADPPYGETSLGWDRWVDGWPALAARAASSMWCFGSMRMLLERAPEFADWKLSQDIVWEKNNGSGFARDRFRRVHEHITHWYRGPWSGIHADVPRTAYSGPDKSARGASNRAAHAGKIGAHAYVDNGTRLARSVVQAGAVRYRRRHPTEKPLQILDLLVRYGCPPGGLVMDPFAGSSSTLEAAAAAGMRAVGIEWREDYCETSAVRLAALVAAASV